MPIAFFVTEAGDFYADMEASVLDETTYNWLSRYRIDLGRKASFTVFKESPLFADVVEAEAWLVRHWFSPQVVDDADADVEPGIAPTVEQYEDCAGLAHEINEMAAMGSLAELLPLETDHSYLCQLGVWYWSLGHRILAAMAFERSIEILPEPPTYFNLAVCRDDMGQKDRAEAAMGRFYELVSSTEEREQAEAMLEHQGKSHLIRHLF